MLVAAVVLVASQYGLPPVRLQSIAECVRMALRGIRNWPDPIVAGIFKKIRAAADGADVCLVFEFTKDSENQGAAKYINSISAHEGDSLPKPQVADSALVIDLGRVWRDLRTGEIRR